MRNINFNRISYFIAVIDTGSITSAAKVLGISKAVVSKQILTLEAELGTTLLHRNTRSMRPTDIGLKFYEKSKVAFVQAKEAFAEVQSTRNLPEGFFRVTAPIDYGTLHLAPLAAQFARNHKGVNIDLFLTDNRLDPIEHNFDLSFRVGWLDDSSNQMRRVSTFDEWLVASPEMFQRINEPWDLVDCPFIANASLKTATKWQFRKGDEVQNISVTAALTLNASPAISRAIMSSAYFSILPDFLVCEDVFAGRLIRLLPDWTLRTGGIYAVTPPMKFKPLVIRNFIDLVCDYHKKLSANKRG